MENKPNMNWENYTIEPLKHIPGFEKKHDVSKKALKTLEKVMFTQDEYGFDKYKKAFETSI